MAEFVATYVYSTWCMDPDFSNFKGYHCPNTDLLFRGMFSTELQGCMVPPLVYILHYVATFIFKSLTER